MPDTPPKIITRFAPSPTGHLHIGGARTALFNWAFARKHGGTFILRIEDTDKARSTDAATRGILDDLRWLGITWDEGPAHNPPPEAVKADQIDPRGVGPFFQSQRDPIYKQYLQRLIDMGRAYPDAKGNGAYRFKMPESDITVNDLVLGDVKIERKQLEDFIIIKSDGGPTFHFANVVDDAEMGVTHVLRAQEHLMNTPKHVAMFDALGIPRPQYAHMPLIFNPDGSKMSKRDKAKAARAAAKAHGLPAVGLPDITSDQLAAFMDKKSDDPHTAQAIAQALNVVLPEIDVHDFRVSGYLPEVLLNYVALLGWSPEGKDDAGGERFGLDYIRQHFSIGRIGKTNARFDREKLRAFNGETLAKLPPEVFQGKLRDHLRTYHAEHFGKLCDQPEFALFAAAYQPRARTLDEPTVLGRFFVTGDDELAFDPKAVEKVLRKNDNAGVAVLRDLRAALAAQNPWTPAAIHDALERFAKEKNIGMGDVAQPLRVAVSGGTVSPAIQDTLAILGRTSTLNRIRRCIESSSS